MLLRRRTISRQNASNWSKSTIPDCKTPLNAFYCSDCEHEFPRLGGIPRLLSREFAQTEQVAAAYDAIA